MSEIQTKPSNNPINNKRNPYTVWFVVLAFIAPVVLAYIMFFFVDVRSFVNHGEILNPIVNIDSFKLKNEAGELIAKDTLTYKWRLISFLGKDCSSVCAARLHDTRQIHTSLGKNQHRLLRMFIHLQAAGEPLSKMIDENHPDVIHVYGDKEIIIEALGKNIKDGVGITSNETYIMDPMGNVMMRFTVDQPNKEFLYDLKKLLKASQIG
jgi:cytochrome oxidase Cu insertion factor (SCO1/SenC/PrrC family)